MSKSDAIVWPTQELRDCYQLLNAELLYVKRPVIDVTVIATMRELVVIEDAMTKKICERCRMIRFYVVWTLLMGVMLYFYLPSGQ